MRAAAATAANVTGAPARSSSRSAWIALARVSSCRRAAATASGVAGSGRIGGCLLLLAACFECGDDLVQVRGDLLVHLGDSGVVTNIGQVRHELACGQVFTSGSWQYPFGSAWVARDSCCLAQAASPSGPSGLIWTGWPVALTLRAFSQCSRTVLSDSRA